MRRTSLSSWVAGLGFLLVAACGGGGGGGGDGDALLTADPRGASTGGADPLAGAGAAAPGDAAVEHVGDLAREIEEADLHRVDGDRLVLVNAHRGLAVVDLADVEVVSRLALGGMPHEMFLRGDRALVFHTSFEGSARLTVVSLADPAAPAVESTFPLTGAYVASRLVGDV